MTIYIYRKLYKPEVHKSSDHCQHLHLGGFTSHRQNGGINTNSTADITCTTMLMFTFF